MVADGRRLHEAAQPQPGRGGARHTHGNRVSRARVCEGADGEHDQDDAGSSQVPRRCACVRVLEGRHPGTGRHDDAPSARADGVRLHRDPFRRRRSPDAASGRRREDVPRAVRGVFVLQAEDSASGRRGARNRASGREGAVRRGHSVRLSREVARGCCRAVRRKALGRDCAPLPEPQEEDIRPRQGDAQDVRGRADARARAPFRRGAAQGGARPRDRGRASATA